MKQPPTRAFVGGPKVHFGDMDVDAEGVEVTTTGNFERHGTPHPKPHLNAPGGKQIRKPSIDGHILPKHEVFTLLSRSFLVVFNFVEV